MEFKHAITRPLSTGFQTKRESKSHLFQNPLREPPKRLDNINGRDLSVFKFVGIHHQKNLEALYSNDIQATKAL